MENFEIAFVTSLFVRNKNDQMNMTLSDKLTIANLFHLFVYKVDEGYLRWNADSFQFSPTSPQMARAGGLSNNK